MHALAHGAHELLLPARRPVHARAHRAGEGLDEGGLDARRLAVLELDPGRRLHSARAQDAALHATQRVVGVAGELARADGEESEPER